MAKVKVIPYLFVALAFVIAIGVICLIGYGFWFYWHLHKDWSSPN